MKIRFTKPAAQQLATLLAYIAERSPQGAGRVVDRIQDTLAFVAEYPGLGRATQRAGYRRILAHPYPYAIFYRASATEIVVHAVRHAARKPEAN